MMVGPAYLFDRSNSFFRMALLGRLSPAPWYSKIQDASIVTSCRDLGHVRLAWKFYASQGKNEVRGIDSYSGWARLTSLKGGTGTTECAGEETLLKRSIKEVSDNVFPGGLLGLRGMPCGLPAASMTASFPRRAKTFPWLRDLPKSCIDDILLLVLFSWLEPDSTWADATSDGWTCSTGLLDDFGVPAALRCSWFLLLLMFHNIS